ncbi:hypothetical protein [Halorussus pelagicus]|uniref:hypothetical protein n=1 Tax=Halorussus pelagicus TaxID=2505977 RepID=UPI000FFC523F|nr:hypothetical protein [Halorussus pelagicus]
MKGVDGERLRSVAVTLALLLAAASGALAASAHEGDDADSRSGVVSAQETTTAAPGENDSTNATVEHRNPGRVGETNASDVESWLQDRMVERLVRSIDVSERDSERARRLVGNDSQFEEFADKYAELKGEASSEDRNLSDLDGVGAIQSAFLADVRDYRTALRRYQRVRENETVERERRLAHELERRLAAVNRSSVALQRSYANVSSEGNATANATRQIETVRTDVLATQRTVRNQTLVRTDLSVETVAPNGSFTDRVTLRGRLLTAANASAISDRNVTLRIENRSVEARTNETGHFEVAYRPTLTSVGDRNRTVRYQPANASRYLHDNASVRFGVERVNPEFELTNYTQSAGFGDSLAVEGTVTAGNVTTGEVPVVATLAGFPIGQATTGPNGSFALTTTVPANLSTGERPVRVRLADPRFRAANATVSVAVEPTATDLSTEARRANGSLLVSGRLTTDGGTPLGNRTLQLAVNGTAVGTVTTNATGGYAGVVPVPSSVSDSPSARVRAAYSPVGENLNASSAADIVTFERTERGPFDYPLVLRVAGLLGIAAIGVVLARRLGGNDWRLRDDSTPGSSESPEADLSATIPADTGRSADALLDAATDRAADDAYDAAALLAYAAVRKRLDGSVGRASAETHWEFYADCREAGLREDRLADLEQLTETYERAAFAAESVSEREAGDAVESAQTFDSDDESDN